MNLNIEKTEAKKLFPECPEWFQKILKENFGDDFFKKKSFTDIKTFEDACENLEISDNVKILLDYNGNDKDMISSQAHAKLIIITKEINQGWIPNWNDSNQKKWSPWFRLSSGFGFVDSHYGYSFTGTSVGSRLCFESEEKSTYAGKQFIEIYKDLLT